MIEDLIMELVTAANEDDKAGAYERMERMGIDRKTADEMADFIVQYALFGEIVFA